MQQLLDFVVKIDWRLRALVTTLALSVLALIGVMLIGLWPSSSAIAGALLLAIVVSSLLFSKIRRWLDRMDWRVGAILLATAVAAAATLLAYAAGIGTDPSTFLGAIFAGWISGVALFVVVGVVVAVVSLARPEEESVESRARILFRGQKGRHIDYIVGRIRRVFEQYADDVSNVMTISDYDAATQTFLLMSEGKTTIRGYIDDVPSTYRSSISLVDVTPSPAGRVQNRLVYLHVGKQHFDGQEFGGGAVDFPFDATIAEGSDCLIASGLETWIKADTEENTFAPVRFSRRIRLTVRNHLRGGSPLRLKISLDGGQTYDEWTVRSGEEKLLCDLRDVEPETEVYDIRFLP
jgi:hypothetical protein